MKKIIYILCTLCMFMMLTSISYADNCQLINTEVKKDEQGNVIETKKSASTDGVSGLGMAALIEDCISDTGVYVSGERANAEGGLRDTVIRWTQTLAVLLGLLSVLGIVVGALYLALSGGNDERVNKGKSIVKWSILGVLAVMFASTIIVLIVNIFYSI